MDRSIFISCAAFMAAASLAGCGTLVKGQTQEVTLATPGATEAVCIFDNGVRYKLSPGDTVDIMRSGSDMKVDCYASGNRHKSLTVPRGFNRWSVANIANGVVPGVAYDHFSHGLYEYPPVITVDFTGVPALGYETPDYHNKDAPNPYQQLIEDYGPGTPRIASDSAYMQRDVERTGMGLGGSNPYESLPSKSGRDVVGVSSNRSPEGTSTRGGYLSSPDAAWSPAPVSKSVPQAPSRAVPAPVSSAPRGANAEQLNRTMNPTVFGGNQ